MRADAHQKIKPTHLKRIAYLYIRQSRLRQVFENVESTKRQYALRQHAVALGWQQDQIVVIDSDLGQVRPRIVKAFSIWLRRSAGDVPVSCSG
jgi:hypothetical protein